MSVTYIQTTHRETFLLLLFLPLRHSQLPTKHFQEVGLGLQVGARQISWTLSVLSEETRLAWGYCSRRCCKRQPVKGCVKELSHSISQFLQTGCQELLCYKALPWQVRRFIETQRAVSQLSTECHIHVPLRIMWRWEQAKQSVEEGSSTIPMCTSWCLETACRCIERGDKTDCFHCKRQKKKKQAKSLTIMQCSGALYSTACLADSVLVSCSFKRQSLLSPTPWEAGVTVVLCVIPREPGHWQHHPCTGTVSATTTWLPLLVKGHEIQLNEQWKPVPCSFLGK